MARHLATIVLLCATSLLRAQQPTESPYTLKQVGPNAWAAIDNSNAKAPAGANAGFVIGDDGVVVIDTFASADAATRLLADIRMRTAAPVKFVVNTHYHADHAAGNAVFANAGATVVAQRNVRGWIHTENLKFLGPESQARAEGVYRLTSGAGRRVRTSAGSLHRLSRGSDPELSGTYGRGFGCPGS